MFCHAKWTWSTCVAFYKMLLTNVLCGYIRFHNEGEPPSRIAVVNEIMYVEEI